MRTCLRNPPSYLWRRQTRLRPRCWKQQEMNWGALQRVPSAQAAGTCEKKKKKLAAMYMCVVKCLTGKRISVCTQKHGSGQPAQFNNSQGRRVGNAPMKFSPAMALCFFIWTCMVACLSVCVSLFTGTSKRAVCGWHICEIAPRGKQRSSYTIRGLCFHACLKFHIKATWDQMSHLPVPLNEESLYKKIE